MAGGRVRPDCCQRGGVLPLAGSTRAVGTPADVFSRARRDYCCVSLAPADRRMALHRRSRSCRTAGGGGAATAVALRRRRFHARCVVIEYGVGASKGSPLKTPFTKQEREPKALS